MAKIPVVPSYSPLGHVSAYASDPLQFLEKQQEKYGDIFRFRVAHRYLTVIHHPDHIRQVMQENHSKFRKNLAYRKLSLLLGQGLFTSEGEFWLRQRRLAAPAFHKERLLAYFEYILRLSSDTLSRWNSQQEVDVNSELTDFTLAVISKTLLGIDLKRDSNTTIEKELPFALHFLLKRIVRPINIPMSFPIPAHTNFRRSVHKLNSLISELIRNRKSELSDDLLSMLLSTVDEAGEGMSEKQLRDEVLTFYLAGHETTAIALVWTIWLLSQHPEIFKKLRAESNQLSDNPSMEEVLSLPYIKAVVQESMRLYSPVWILGREALQPLELTGGYRLRKGDSVIFSPYLVHRHKEFWENPDTFMPERFLTSNEMHKFAYFPFGGGPRLCIGQSFAMMEMMTFLWVLGKNRSDLSIDSNAALGFQYSLTLRPDRNIKLIR